MGCDLFVGEMQVSGGLANPATYMDGSSIPFFFQWLLVTFQPAAVWAFVDIHNALVLWYEHMFFLTRGKCGRNGLHGDVVIFTHEAGDSINEPAITENVIPSHRS